MQEFFSSKDTKVRLEELLIHNGFVPDLKFKLCYESMGVFVYNIEPINVQLDLIEKMTKDGSEYRHGFSVELSEPLEKLPAIHPIFGFFRSLTDPIILSDRKPRYDIKEYLRKE